MALCGLRRPSEPPARGDATRLCLTSLPPCKRKSTPSHQADALLCVCISQESLIYIVTFVTSFLPPYDAHMDKVDYEAKLAAEVLKLQDFQKSLQSEYAATHIANTEGEPELDPAQVAKELNQKFLRNAIKAVDSVIYLMEFADKDSVKFAVAKYIIDNIKNNPEAKGETLDDLLKQLTANSTDAAAEE